MSYSPSNNSIDLISSDAGPVPAYEANPTPVPDTQSTAPATDEITVYGAVTVQQLSATSPNTNDQNSTVVSENKYTLQPVSPTASPAQQQMQQQPPPQQQLQLTPQQQQLLQLTPQQQQQLLLLAPQQQQMQQVPLQQQQMQQVPQQQQQMQQLPLQQPQQMQQLPVQQQQMQQLPVQQQLYSQQPQQQLQQFPQQPQQQLQQFPQQQQEQQQQGYRTALRLANLQEAGAPVDCPVCGHREVTIVEKVSGNTTHLWAAMLCIFTGLGCIPYLMYGTKDSQHKCGHCGVFLARWHKSGRTEVLQHG